MNLVDEVRRAWGWIEIDPLEVIGGNDFGNLIIKDVKGKYWRLCPEECTCEVIASSRENLDVIASDQEFLHDWYMNRLVDLASKKLGMLPEGSKYFLRIPAVLGGEYRVSNFAIAPLHEIIGISGHIARQIKNLPDGATVQLKVSD